jgi:tubulin polyglutamylase TTLL9
MMLRAFKEKGGVWIMKPVSGRQGKGIFLVNKPSQIDSWLKQSAKEKEVEDQKTVSYVAQKYIHNPYLVVIPPPQPAQQRRSLAAPGWFIVHSTTSSVGFGCGWIQGGKKFDLRIFALVLSYAPLKVYLYREGFARFTNTTYSLDKEDLSNSSVHLTNHAVQKKDADYDATKSDLKWCVPCFSLHVSPLSPTPSPPVPPSVRVAAG